MPELLYDPEGTLPIAEVRRRGISKKRWTDRLTFFEFCMKNAEVNAAECTREGKHLLAANYRKVADSNRADYEKEKENQQRTRMNNLAKKHSKDFEYDDDEDDFEYDDE